jgi:O-antigen biosynthesis protein
MLSNLFESALFEYRRVADFIRRGLRSVSHRGLFNTVKRGVDVYFFKPYRKISAADLIRYRPSGRAISAPSNRSIEISIIVPVYNQWAITENCLAALQATIDLTRTEIILVDDASPESPPEWITQSTGIGYMRLEKNLGFIEACNTGAAKSSGSWLCFLNNDTEVQPNWLSKLEQVFINFPDTGIATAQLLFPDGQLQEAGGIIYRDGVTANYGKFEGPHHPFYQHLRECDYGSGACMLIRRSDFDAAGQFNSVYKPAYYEDVDLAMRVAQAGKKIRYQPHARVIHLEGASSGTSTSAGIKKHQLINQKTFCQQWEKTLTQHPDKQYDPDYYSDARWRYQRHVLWIDASLPNAKRDAGSLRTLQLCKLLNDIGCSVDFVPNDRITPEDIIAEMASNGVCVWTSSQFRTPPHFLRSNAKKYTHIIVSRHYVLEQWIELIKKYAPDAKLIFDSVDLHGIREQREASLNSSQSLVTEAKKTLAKELELINQSNETWVVSDEEDRFLKSLSLTAPHRIISTVHSVAPGRNSYRHRSGIIFVANFRHLPNADGIRWFAEEVWPLVKTENNMLELNVVGDYMKEELKADLKNSTGIHLLGPVDNLDELLNEHRMTIAPLRFGAGVKGKITQSLAHGLPVVTTSIGAEGIPEAEKAMLIEDGPDAFANAICELYQNEEKWRALQSEGLRIAEAYFSPDAAKKNLKAALGL